MKQYITTVPYHNSKQFFQDLIDGGGKIVWSGPDMSYCKVKCTPDVVTFLSLKYNVFSEEAKG